MAKRQGTVLCLDKELPGAPRRGTVFCLDNTKGKRHRTVPCPPCVSKDFIALCRSFSIAGLREFKSIGENPENLNIQDCADNLLLFHNALRLAILTFIFYSGKMKLENILTTVLRHGRKCENKT